MKDLNFVTLAVIFGSLASTASPTLAGAEQVVTARECTLTLTVPPHIGSDLPEYAFSAQTLERRMEELGYRVIQTTEHSEFHAHSKSEAEFELSVRFDRGCALNTRSTAFSRWMERNFLYPVGYSLSFQRNANEEMLVERKYQSSDYVMRGVRSLRRALREIPQCERE